MAAGAACRGCGVRGVGAKPGLRRAKPQVQFCRASPGAGRPAFLVVTSALMGALYVGCALFAETGSLWAPFALNVGAAALYALQLAAGSARLAAGLRSARYALLFSCNTLAGLAAAALAQAVGAGVGLGANGYYLVAAAAQVAVAAAALLPLGGAPDDESEDGAPMVEDEGGAEPG